MPLPGPLRTLLDGRAVTGVLCLHAANGDVDGRVFDGDYVSRPAHRGNIREIGSPCCPPHYDKDENWLVYIAWRREDLTRAIQAGRSTRFLLFR